MSSAYKSGVDQVARTDSVFALGDKSGFENKDGVTLAYGAGTRTLTLTPVGADFSVWVDGTRWTFTAPVSATHTDVEGMHYFFIDTDGVLKSATALPDFDRALAYFLYWNSVANATEIESEERHRDENPVEHQYHHNTIGTAYWSGLAITHAAQLAGNPPDDTTSRVYMGGGVISDEDLIHTIVNAAVPAADFEQDLGTDLGANPAELEIYYLDGAAGLLRHKASTGFAVDGLVANAPFFNEFALGVWGLAQIANRKFVNYWVAATGSPVQPVILIVGQIEHDTLTDAQAETIGDINLGTFPFPEVKVLYRLTYEHRTNYNLATYRCVLRAVADVRASSQAPGASVSTSHSALADLAYDSAGHTGFQRATTIAVVAPTANNDDSDTAALGNSFVAGDLWLDTATGTLYKCEDATVTAAVWTVVGEKPPGWYRYADDKFVLADWVDAETYDDNSAGNTVALTSRALRNDDTELVCELPFDAIGDRYSGLMLATSGDFDHILQYSIESPGVSGDTGRAIEVYCGYFDAGAGPPVLANTTDYFAHGIRWSGGNVATATIRRSLSTWGAVTGGTALVWGPNRGLVVMASLRTNTLTLWHGNPGAGGGWQKMSGDSAVGGTDGLFGLIVFVPGAGYASAPLLVLNKFARLDAVLTS